MQGKGQGKPCSAALPVCKFDGNASFHPSESDSGEAETVARVSVSEDVWW